MTKEENLFEKRIRELSKNAYEQCYYTYTGFLNMYELSLVKKIMRENPQIPYQIWGGYEQAERAMVQFGSETLFGYEQPFPMSLLLIQPKVPKFSQELSHRDYLGALMHLGIERNLIGDFIIVDKEAYVFVKDTIGPFLMQECTTIRKNQVKIKEIPMQEFQYEPKYKVITGFVASCRLDALISLIYKFSRKESASYIAGQKVFVNGQLKSNPDDQIKEGDIISVRGHGKSRFEEIGGTSKKGRKSVKILQYI